MKLLAILCLVAVACAYPSRLGEEKCTYGPSYWCENYKQAIECEAIEHCRRFVWKPKEADGCDQCKAAVQQFHTLVTTNSSKVLEIMKNVCAGLSTGAAECKLAVDTYGSEIISALAEITADPEKVCQELELCSSVSSVKIIKKILVEKLKTNPHIIAYQSSVKADYCEDCKLVFGEMKDILQDQDLQKEIIAVAEEACAELGSFAGQCKSYVDMYLPLVLDELASLDDPSEICTELGLCNSTKKAVDIMSAVSILQPQAKKLLIPLMHGPVILTPPKKNEKSDDDKCDECKAVVKQLNYYLTNNASKVLEVMSNLCGLLGSSFAPLCKQYVQSSGDAIIKQLKEMTADSDKLCKELEMCKSAGKEQIIKKVILERLQNHPYIIALRSVKGDDYCNDCKLVFAELKDLLEDKSMQEEITNLLESVCAELGSAADECKTFVDAYMPLIFEELVSLVDPTTLCTELGLCNSTMKAVEVLEASRLVPAAKITPVAETKKIQSPEAGPECLICEFAMRELESILGDNATKEEIEAALEKVCSLLPSTIRSECDAFVAEYGSKIIELLLQELQPDQVCAALGLCSSEGKRAKLTLKKPTDETCDLCKMAVQYIQSLLESNATEEEIKEALEELCNLLPASLKTECLTLVDKYTADLVWLLTEFPPYAVCKCDAIVAAYGDLIIKIILGEITPEEVCELLKLCTASKKLPIKDGCALGEPYWCKSYKNAQECNDLINLEGDSIKRNVCKLLLFFNAAEQRKEPKDQTLCQECMYAVNCLGNLFPKNTTKEQIWRGLEIFCSRFPPSTMKDCDAVLKQYGDFLVKLLLGEIDPSAFCKKLGLCPSSLEPKEQSDKISNEVLGL